jgi:hypothetical protein
VHLEPLVARFKTEGDAPGERWVKRSKHAEKVESAQRCMRGLLLFRSRGQRAKIGVLHTSAGTCYFANSKVINLRTGG